MNKLELYEDLSDQVPVGVGSGFVPDGDEREEGDLERNELRTRRNIFVDGVRLALATVFC